MQAVILAAGRSTRTYPLTATRPKPLLPVWDRPLLEHQLGQLEGLAREALLVVGYRREQIEARFGDSYRGIRLRYIEQKQQRGTADAVLAAREAARDRLVILNGDDFYHRDDLEALVAGGRGLLVTRAPDPQNRAVVTLAEDGERILDIVEKPADPPAGSWCSVGGYCVEAADLHLLDDLPASPRGELELPDFILRLIERHRVRAQRITEFWLPLTYAWDVLTAMSVLFDDPARADTLGLGRAEPSKLPASASIDGPIWMGDNVRLARSARLVGPVSLGTGSVVGEGAIVERSALFEGAEIGEGARVSDSVVGASARVGAGAVLESLPGEELTVSVKGKPVVPELPRFGSVIGDGAQVPSGATVPAGSLLDAASESRSA